MKPPKENFLHSDVEFYLHIISTPQTRSPDCRDELLKELHDTYGKEQVEEEIKNQTNNQNTTTMKAIQTLQDWVDASPNASPKNNLIQTIGTKNGKPVYYSYRWNLRWNDGNEPDVYTDTEDRVITSAQAHALL